MTHFVRGEVVMTMLFYYVYFQKIVKCPNILQHIKYFNKILVKALANHERLMFKNSMFVSIFEDTLSVQADS